MNQEPACTIMDEEQKRFTINMARHIELFDSMIRQMGYPRIAGLSDLENTIRFGRPLGKRKERFIENMIRSIESLEPYPEGKGIEGLAETTRKAFEEIDICMQRIETDDPLEFRKTHSTFMDIEQMGQTLMDMNVSARRLKNLLATGKPETIIPSLVTQYNTVFENWYKPVNGIIQDLLKDCIKNRSERNERIEEILSIERTHLCKDGVKSDLRCIRNAISHPRGCDCYDHYHFEFEDGSSQDMSIEEFHRTLALMTNKTTLVWRSLDVFLDFRMYHLLFERTA